MEIKQLKKDTPIFATKLPKEILEEIDKWIIDCKKIKEHKLSYLKERKPHDTCNNYQFNLPKKFIEDGFFLSYLLRLCADTFGGVHNDYYIPEEKGHFHGYDIWVNFSYKNNYNGPHYHSGTLSGIIYYKNDNLNPTIFPDHNIAYEGTEKTILIFPSSTTHLVDKLETNNERITIAFNVLKK